MAEGGSDERRLRAIIAGSAGSLVEWYDFYVYAFGALYFSAEFFPKSDALVQVMATSGIFAVGFLMRPIGGWYFGRLADRDGRQRALVASVVMMGLGSLAIALLPTYRQIGIAAPILLLLSRMVQGFATGGQYGTVATYLSEIARQGRRGFWSSFQYVTLIGGQLLASVTILLLESLLSESALKTYGWRVGFLIGAFGAAAILLFRRQMVETARPGDAQGAGSLSALFRHHMRAFVTVMALTAGGSLAFYTFTTYMQKYLVLTAGMTASAATRVMTVALLIFMLIQPVLGSLSDRIGRRANILIFGAAATLFTVPILSGIGAATSPLIAFGLVLAGLIINGFYTSVSGLFKAEMFPAEVRALGVGLAYGVANALFGGTAENVALAFKSGGHESGFYWYVTLLCAVSFLAALTLADTRKQDPLQDVKI